MQRRAAAEGDQGAAFELRAALDGVDAGGIGHVLFDDLGNAEGRQRGVELEQLADMGVQRGGPKLGIERDRAAGEAVGIDAAQHERWRRSRPGRAPPQAVAGGARIADPALGTDGDALHPIDAGHRAAAGADLDHLDHRDAHRAGRCPS